jgi:hypothetical protein
LEALMVRKKQRLAKSLVFTPFLTGSGSAALDRKVQKTYVGQAHFAVGPEYCSSCSFHGYWQQFRSASGELVGPQEIPGHAWACRYYEKKREEG